MMRENLRSAGKELMCLLRASILHVTRTTMHCCSLPDMIGGLLRKFLERDI